MKKLLYLLGGLQLMEVFVLTSSIVSCRPTINYGHEFIWKETIGEDAEGKTIRVDKYNNPEALNKIVKITKMGYIEFSDENSELHIKPLGIRPNVVEVPSQLPKEIDVLDRLFENNKVFNSSNISNWNTSNVVSMKWMFLNAQSFNQDLLNWDVSNIRYYESFDNSANEWNEEYKPNF